VRAVSFFGSPVEEPPTFEVLMSVRVRFAPSPTGFLHVGGARTALFNYLFARRERGTFVLRIEDTDAARSTEESLRAILDGLHWLGLTWDEGPGAGGSHGPYVQSERRELYQGEAEALLEAGRAYRCFCTPEELEERRAAQLARGEPPRYDGRCRDLDDAARARFLAEGRRPALRFRLEEEGEVAWEDVVRGRVAFRGDVLDDFVILRSDGNPTYNFAAVVDDHAMAITHVVRGDDHISNTPRQILIYRAAGWTLPTFAHVPMILGGDGSRLSKRHGATSVSAYRELGYLPSAMVNFLALLGWSFDGERELFTLAELEEVFRLDRVGSNPAVFNLEKLEWMNGQHLKRLSEEDKVVLVSAFLRERGWDLDGRDPEWLRGLVHAIGDRLKTLADAETYGAFALRDTLEMDPEAWKTVIDRTGAGDHLKRLAERIEADGAFTTESLEKLTRGLAQELGIKAGELMGAARVALTGRRVAPGLFEVMWLLGKSRCVGRLEDAAARWVRETRHARA
jgi:glutamyl-tRNA synthetase